MPDFEFGFGGCGWFIWIILIFAIFGGGMWGNNRDDGFLSATMQRGFDNGTVVSKLDGITNGLRDRLEAKDRELLTANFNLSQQAQTYSLVNEIRPVSKPAYITCSPYAANGNGSCLGCGC